MPVRYTDDFVAPKLILKIEGSLARGNSFTRAKIADNIIERLTHHLLQSRVTILD